MWLVFTLGSTFCGGFIGVCLRKSKESDSVSSALLGPLAYNAAFIIIGLFRGYLGTFSWSLVWKFFPIFVLHLTSDIFIILSSRFARLSVTAPFGKVRTLLPLIYSYIFFHERLTVTQWSISIVLIVLAVLSTLVDRGDEDSKIKKGEYIGIIMTLIFSVCNATYSFMTKILIVEYNDPFIVYFYICSMSSIALLLYAVVTKQTSKLNFKENIKEKPWFLGYIACNITAGILNKLSYVQGPISIIYILHDCGIVISTLASRFILHEKISKKKYIIIALIFVFGVMLSFAS